LLVLRLLSLPTPLLNSWFHSAPIGWESWAVALGFSVLIFLVVEVAKAVGRRLGY
jgi:hypothetical protein